MKMQPQTKLASPRFQARLALGLLVGVALVPCLLPQVALAQTAGAVQPLEDFQNKDGGTDLFSDRSNGASSLFNLMHRAAFGGMRSADDFGSEQQQNLNDAAAQFRAQQLKRLKQQPSTPASATPAAPILEIAPVK